MSPACWCDAPPVTIATSASAPPPETAARAHGRRVRSVMGGVNAANNRDTQRATVCVPTTAMSAAGTVARAPIRTLSLYQYPVSSDPQPGRPVDAMTNRRMHAAHQPDRHHGEQPPRQRSDLEAEERAVPQRGSERPVGAPVVARRVRHLLGHLGNHEQAEDDDQGEDEELDR